MIVEVLKLIADNGPMLCAAFTNIMNKQVTGKLQASYKPSIRYMTDEEVMKYLIQMSNEKK